MIGKRSTSAASTVLVGFTTRLDLESNKLFERALHAESRMEPCTRRVRLDEPLAPLPARNAGQRRRLGHDAHRVTRHQPGADLTTSTAGQLAKHNDHPRRRHADRCRPPATA